MPFLQHSRHLPTSNREQHPVRLPLKLITYRPLPNIFVSVVHPSLTARIAVTTHFRAVIPYIPVTWPPFKHYLPQLTCTAAVQFEKYVIYHCIVNLATFTSCKRIPYLRVVLPETCILCGGYVFFCVSHSHLWETSNSPPPDSNIHRYLHM